MNDSPEPIGSPPAGVPLANGSPGGATHPPTPAADLLTYAIRSSGGLFVLCGMWVVGSAWVTLNGGPDWYGRGPNKIIQDDQQRSDRFYTMFSTVLGAGVALTAVGGIISLRQRWAVYLGFPVTLAAALICFEALFASNAGFLWFMVFAVFAPMLLCADLVWVLISYRDARIEAEFQVLRADGGGGDDCGGDGVAKLVRLLRHSKKGIRVEAIRELTSMGPPAAPAVPELITSLLQATPPALSEKGVCMFCAQALSIWTRDRLKTEEHPKGLPCCKGCRDRLVNGGPSEAHLVAEALGAIGPAASLAVPALRKVALSYDPFLKTACRAAIQRIDGTVVS